MYQPNAKDLLQSQRDIVTQSPGPNVTDHPRVLVAVAGPKREIKLDYDNAVVQYQADYKCNTPTFFNAVTKSGDIDQFLFIGDGYDLADEHVVSQLVETTLSDQFIGFSGIYTDVTIVHAGIQICTKFSPSCSLRLLAERVPINVPFMVVSDLVPTFDEKLEMLYLWDGIISIMKRSLLFHLPKPLFIMNNALVPLAISKEFNRINALRFS